MHTECIFEKQNVRFFNPQEAPFRIHGVWMENGLYRRMPENVAKYVSQGVLDNSRCSAGGRIRFVTDSPYVIIRVSSRTTVVGHQALTGHAGFDLYTTCDGETRYGGTFILPVENESNYDSIVELETQKKQIITINFPLFAEVSSVMVGLADGCIPEEAPDYTHKTPIVYYGSSITHGGCASRAGTAYTSIASRRLDADFISLGFNGSARGELEMVRYINSLEMSVFVLDYDHNSPLEELKINHFRMVELIRRDHPDLPILMLSRPKYYLNEEEVVRCNLIKKTYELAKSLGDENIWFLSGPELMAEVKDDGTVDGCHPTDSGFLSMANAVTRVLTEIFTKEPKGVSKMSVEYPTRGIIDKLDVKFFNPEQAPFRLHGVWKEGGIFRRMPDAEAQKVSNDVYNNSRCSAGGRVRFITDSPYVIIRTKLETSRDCHGSLTGGAGYDLYTTYEGETRYGGTFMFPADFKDAYESIVELPPRKQIITINMPSFAEVREMIIGLKEGCLLEEAPDYSRMTPIVYYGSSITHGGCSSRAGTSYTSMVSRRFDSDYTNLGFNGSARGQVAMAEYIAKLNMSVFVMDYDHNSPLEELAVNHGRMFDIIRSAQPELPILMMSRPKFYLNEEEVERCKVVKGTYERAKAAGDENVWFLSGPELMALTDDEGTVDGCHPTDLGFFSMANAVSKVMEEIFAKADK